MGQKLQTHDKKRSLCTDAPLPFLSGGRGVSTQATKKRLLKRRHLSTTGYPSTPGIFEIMSCVILTSNAIIWYLPPRLSRKHEGLSQKKTLKIIGSKMSPFLTTSFWVSPSALQIRFNLLGKGCHIQTHCLFPWWDTLVRIFPST